MGNTEYTFRNTAGDLLNEKGRMIIDKALDELKCKRCGSSLSRVTYQEGDEIHCETKEGWHETGYDIDIWSVPPKIIETEPSKCDICRKILGEGMKIANGTSLQPVYKGYYFGIYYKTCSACRDKIDEKYRELHAKAYDRMLKAFPKE